MTFAQDHNVGLSRGMRAAVTILLPPSHRQSTFGEAHYRFALLLLATGALDRAQGQIEEAVRIRRVLRKGTAISPTS